MTTAPSTKSKLKVGVIIDYGNTDTRFRIELDNRTFLGKLSNEFAVVPEGYSVHPRYQNIRSSIFDYMGVRYANGVIVSREFKDKEIRPTKGSKVEQLSTALTTHLVLMRVYTILSASLSVPISSVDIVIDFTVLLPPKQQEFKSEAMRELLKSFTKVSQVFPTASTFEFTHGSDAIVESEAVAAFFGAVFKDPEMKVENGDIAQLDKGGLIRYISSADLKPIVVPENKFALRGYTLLLDVGGGSSDLAVIEDGELLENSKETFDIGGRYVSAQLQRVLSAKYFTPRNIDEVIATGILEEGDIFHDVSAELSDAKREFASVMLKNIREYLESQSLDLRVFRGLLVVGGGSLASKAWGIEVAQPAEGEAVKKYDLYTPSSDLIPVGSNGSLVVTSPPMTDILEERLREVAPNIKSVTVPEGEQRILNIQGAGLIHRKTHFSKS